MSSPSRLHLFEGFGVELEYMIADVSTLDLKPVADKVLFAAAGGPANEVELGDMAWSNELVLHVLEMKTNGPAPALGGLAARFHRHVVKAGELLRPLDAVLLPTAMHPWMNPERETRIWPHEQNEIYRSYDRIFGVRGHGWSNLQSTHINLPFNGNREFVRLHAAVRAVLPLVPALAASSPMVGGRLTGLLDTRLEYYRNNQKRIPSITGRVVPETVRSIRQYKEDILQTIYRDIGPHDPDKILCREWLNSRGAIARFDRGAIEIRIVDIQECPRADLAVVAAIVKSIEALTEERWVSIEDLQRLSLDVLERIFLDSLRHGGRTVVDDGPVKAAFGLRPGKPIRTNDVWAHLIEHVVAPDDTAVDGWGEVLALILRQGSLAQRMQNALGVDPSRRRILEVYRRLQACLAEGELFSP